VQRRVRRRHHARRAQDCGRSALPLGGRHVELREHSRQASGRAPDPIAPGLEVRLVLGHGFLDHLKGAELEQGAEQPAPQRGRRHRRDAHLGSIAVPGVLVADDHSRVGSLDVPDDERAVGLVLQERDVELRETEDPERAPDLALSRAAGLPVELDVRMHVGAHVVVDVTVLSAHRVDGSPDVHARRDADRVGHASLLVRTF
jgi:hypothetical protein